MKKKIKNKELAVEQLLSQQVIDKAPFHKILLKDPISGVSTKLLQNFFSNSICFNQNYLFRKTTEVA